MGYAASWEKRSDRAPMWAVAAFTLIIVILILNVWIFSSYMEAKTYTKLTGKEVSTWEAMWVDLRVMEGVQK